MFISIFVFNHSKIIPHGRKNSKVELFKWKPLVCILNVHDYYPPCPICQPFCKAIFYSSRCTGIRKSMSLWKNSKILVIFQDNQPCNVHNINENLAKSIVRFIEFLVTFLILIFLNFWLNLILYNFCQVKHTSHWTLWNGEQIWSVGKLSIMYITV